MILSENTVNNSCDKTRFPLATKFISYRGIFRFYYRYPRVILKLLTPLAFWTLGQVKNFAHSKVKRGDWTGRKREEVGQLCPSTETAGLWSIACADCTHLINQSTTTSSCKAVVLPENVPDLDSANSGYPSLNYPRSRIELALVLAIITSFWRISCIGNRWEECENESFWPASVQRHSWLAFNNFFSIHEQLSTISSHTLSWSSVHLLFFPVLKIERNQTGTGSFKIK